MKIELVATELVALLREKGMTFGTAESCTGGGVGYSLTAVSGSSSVYLGGVVSYANSVKAEVLGVAREILAEYGAVSEPTAAAMAQGVRKLLKCDVSVSITGIAGPASDDTNKPVGLVYIGVSSRLGTYVKENHFSGNRDAVREQSILKALEMVKDHIA